MDKELLKVKGQCENCGINYAFHLHPADLNRVTCPECGNLTENWDTPDEPQMAPSLIAIRTNA